LKQANKVQAQGEKETRQRVQENVERLRMAREDVGRPIFVESDPRRPKKFLREAKPETAPRKGKPHPTTKQKVREAMMEKTGYKHGERQKRVRE